MQESQVRSRAWRSLILWTGVALALFAARRIFGVPPLLVLPGDMSIFRLVGITAGVIALTRAFTLATMWRLGHLNKPAIEAVMVSKLYGLLSAVVIARVLASGFGKL